MTSTLVSCIIISYNRPHSTIKCLESISKSLNCDYEIIVVDNNSTKENLIILKNYLSSFSSEVKLIQSGGNWLTSGAVNLGAQSSKGDYLLLLADDNSFDENTICELLSSHKATNSKITGPLTYFDKPFDALVFSAGARMSSIGLPTKNYSAGAIKRRADSNHSYEVEVVHNCFMVDRYWFFSLGGFDVANFPMHNEEADFCKRTSDMGGKISVAINAHIWHDVNFSDERLKIGSRDFGIDSPLRAYLNARNRILYIRKHSNVFQKIIFAIFIFPLMSIFYIALIISSKKTRINLTNFLAGSIDGWTNNISKQTVLDSKKLPFMNISLNYLYSGKIPVLKDRIRNSNN